MTDQPTVIQVVTFRGLGLRDLRDALDQMLTDGVPPDAETAGVHSSGSWVNSPIGVRWPGELPPRCRLCGCTESRACEGGCGWVEDPEGKGDLCSACLPAVEAGIAATSTEEA